MGKLNITYTLHDRSYDPMARERANHAPKLLRSLADLGFTSLGVLEARVKNQQRFIRTLSSLMSDADVELINRSVEQGEAVEITVSPDKTTFGVVERTVGGPVVTLLTIMENGVLVETVMRPSRAPNPPRDRQLTLAQRMLGLLLHVDAGQPLIWPHQAVPAGGCYVELIKTQDVFRLHERHCARVQTMQGRYRTTIPRHDSLALYRATRVRFAQVVQHLNRWNNTAGILLIALLVPLIFFWIWLSRPANTLVQFLDTLLILAFALLALFGTQILGRAIAPWIPLPLVSRQQLLDLQEEEWGGP